MVGDGGPETPSSVGLWPVDGSVSAVGPETTQRHHQNTGRVVSERATAHAQEARFSDATFRTKIDDKIHRKAHSYKRRNRVVRRQTWGQTYIG